MLALGDSLTAGYGLAPEDGLVPQLSRWLADHGHPAQVINAGRRAIPRMRPVCLPCLGDGVGDSVHC